MLTPRQRSRTRNPRYLFHQAGSHEHRSHFARIHRQTLDLFRPACFNPILRVVSRGSGPKVQPTSAVKHDDHSLSDRSAARPKPTSTPIPNLQTKASDKRPKSLAKTPDPQPDRVSLHDVKISSASAWQKRATAHPKMFAAAPNSMRLNPLGEALSPCGTHQFGGA